MMSQTGKFGEATVELVFATFRAGHITPKFCWPSRIGGASGVATEHVDLKAQSNTFTMRPSADMMRVEDRWRSGTAMRDRGCGNMRGITITHDEQTHTRSTFHVTPKAP